MKFGAHVSIKDGIANAPQRAFEIGCECFQLFTRSPHGGQSPAITREAARNFQLECRKYNFDDYYVHTPYYINLASADIRIYYGSISAIKRELEAADLIGARGVVTHLGSARELGKKDACQKLVRALVKIFESPSKAKDRDKKKTYRQFDAKLFLEITAGAGEIMGDTFEEIALFIKEAEKTLPKNTLGVCFDTAHVFVSGYDLRGKEEVKKTFDAFEKIIGMERLGLVHCNDSLADFNSHVDRHDNIGNGKIGLEGIESIVGEPRLAKIDFIIETPLGKEKKELKTLKSFRQQVVV